MEKERSYLAIDLKSFYASVECCDRNLDPLEVNLVVADESRSDKTICLAVSPALKSFGVPGRARLFEVKQRVMEVNAKRQRCYGRPLKKRSFCKKELERDPSLFLDFLVAPPRMAKYIEVSSQIYSIYLRFVSSEDIHVYSIDEVFVDVTDYIKIYALSAEELARKMIRTVYEETGITATAGIGTNLYLAKVAMDILAKHAEADKYGVRIASLDEMSYRRALWEHEPLDDFWRVGHGYVSRLHMMGLYTMGDIARCSLENEDKLYQTFGVNAELLIDHAWGYESCKIKDIKAYRPKSNSLGQGQVLQEAYPYDKARLVIIEMADSLALSLVSKGLVTQQIHIAVGYDKGNVQEGKYRGPVSRDTYGRAAPPSVHGGLHLKGPTSSSSILMEAAGTLFARLVSPSLLIRRLTITALDVKSEEAAKSTEKEEQLDLFADYEKIKKEEEEEQEARDREKKLQKTALFIKEKFGKNAILRGMNFEEGATARERNKQIGGHRA